MYVSGQLRRLWATEEIQVASRAYEAHAEILHPAFVLSKPVARGVAWGVAMWSAYALVEYVLYSVLPLFTRPGAVFTPENWRINALILDCYWLLGAITGGVAGAIAHRLSLRSAAGLESRPDLSRLT